ncbi:MAG: hypothetical protein HDR27_02415 [Lachnospiraceae bacterium]|nr:hypothetical protein [Lachnospiraceae bacterium]
MLAFLIWLLFSILFIVYGIHAFRSKKAVPFGFWANAEVFAVKDVRAYNRAVGKLWCVFGIVLAFLGIPLLKGQNSPYVVLSIVGIMAEAIAAMVVYVVVIEKKYRER